jgi:hypothetical protein
MPNPFSSFPHAFGIQVREGELSDLRVSDISNSLYEPGVRKFIQYIWVSLSGRELDKRMHHHGKSANFETQTPGP